MTKAEKLFKENADLKEVFKVPGQEIYFRNAERAAAYGINHGVVLETIARGAKSDKPKEPGTPPPANLKKTLRAEYKKLAGKGAYNGWDEAELQAKIDELKAAADPDQGSGTNEPKKTEE